MAGVVRERVPGAVAIGLLLLHERRLVQRVRGEQILLQIRLRAHRTTLVQLTRDLHAQRRDHDATQLEKQQEEDSAQEEKGL